jgi:hypothetical protein
MSVFNTLSGFLTVNNTSEGIASVGPPPNSTILIENFDGRAAILDTPLNKYIADNVNPDGTSRLRGNVEDLFTEEQKQVSPLLRMTFPASHSAQDRAIIDYDWNNEKPAVPVKQLPGLIKQFELRDFENFNKPSIPDFEQFIKIPKKSYGDSIFNENNREPTVLTPTSLRPEAPEFIPTIDGANLTM